MPSMTTYSPYETLTLFQSIAKYGADASTFQDISTALIENEFVPHNDEQTGERLSASALRVLYEDIVKKERGDHVKVNGNVHSGERSPKRRKLSASPEPIHGEGQSEHQVVQDLVDKLYDRYKEQAIKEIRREEDAYAQLQDEIKSLESKVEALKNEAAQRPATDTAERSGQVSDKQTSKSVNDDTTDEAVPTANVDQHLADPAEGSNLEDLQKSTTTSMQKSTAQAEEASPSTLLNNNQVPRASNTLHQDSNLLPGHSNLSSTGSNIPTPSRSPAPKGNNAVTGAVTPSKGQETPASAVSPASNSQSRPPTRQHVPQGQGTQIPPQQNAYPPYTQYPHQWHPHMVHPQYAQHPGYGPSPYYPQPAPGQHPHTPQQSHFQHYPHTAPMPYGPRHGWHAQPYGANPVSSATTPVSRPASQMSLTRSGSTTPWRRRRDVGGSRAASPKRPERAISPLEPDASVPEPSITQDLKQDAGRPAKVTEEDTPIQSTRTSRRGRLSSKTPSAMVPSRSQSVVSHTSDVVHERMGRGRQDEGIKAEPPSTPLPPPSDSETQRITSRRGRPRNSTLTSQGELSRGPTAKRKRETVSPSPSIPSTTAASGPAQRGKQHFSSIDHDQSLVIVSKNFSRTSQLLLNEITSHKLAGIFAKPLSERDAPGYKDLIHRSQDLKSIKAAISKGSRAALAAIETMESEGETTEGTQTNLVTSYSTPGPIGNGFFLVHKTSELVPPKGIVNGAQLEMELMRMFANAIMFNPLPSSERGFGRYLKLRKNGGDVIANRSHKPDSQDDASEDGKSSEDSDSTVVGGTGWDEGGIIADTREMFDDVSTAVDKWRGLEDERMGTSGQNVDASRTGSIVTPSAAGTHLEVASARHASVSASSNIADDEGDGESTPVPSSVAGTTRKRRKIAEH